MAYIGNGIAVTIVEANNVGSSQIIDFTVTSSDMSNTGVTAGTYGNSSAIPVLTVDQAGRVTAAVTNAVAGVTGFAYTNANNTFTITTGAGTTFSANIVANTISTALQDTGVTAAAYGNSTAIPVITVDAKGRITSATTNTVAGVTGFTWTAANNTLTLSTSIGTYTANLNSWSNPVTFSNTVAAGNTTVTGFANVSSTLQVTGAVTFSNTLSVAGNVTGSAANTTIVAGLYTTTFANNGTTTFPGAVTGVTTLAAGNTTITGFANVTSNIQGGGSLTIAGALSGVTTAAVGNTTVTGFANVSSTLQVTGGSTLTGAISAANTLAVTGAATFSNTVAVTGTSTFTGLITGTVTSANNADYLDGQHGAYYAANSQLASYALLSGATYTGAVSGITTLAAGNTTITGFANVSSTLNVVGATTLTDVTISGNLTTSGTTTYVNSTQLNIGDNLIVLNADLGGAAAPTEDAGITINRGSSANVQFNWDETNDRWALGNTYVAGSLTTTGAGAVGTTLSTGNTTITGFANVTSTLQVSGTSTFTGLITGTITSANNADYLDGQHGAYYAANSQLASYALLSGGLFTGSVNATSFTTTNFIANTTGVYPLSNTAGTALGSSTQRWVLNANTINLSGAATLTSATFGGAVSGITTLAAGNTTITGFANVTSTIQGGSSLTIAGALSGVTTAAMGNTTITGFANVSTTLQVGGNLSATGGTTTISNLNLTGRIAADNPADYSATTTTGLSSGAPIDTFVLYEPNAGTSNTFFPLTRQTAVYTSGYRTHCLTGLYKHAGSWGSEDTGWFVALGGNDGYPTMHWKLTYGTTISNENGFVTIGGSARSPTFYDSDNTSYYVNPANTSTLYALTVSDNTNNDTALSVAPAAFYGTNVRFPGQLAAGSAAGGYPGLGYNALPRSDGTMQYINLDTAWWINYGNSNRLSFLYGSGGAGGASISQTTLGYFDSSSNFYASGSLRSPLVYDTDNTSYYADFASTGTSINTAGDIVSNSDRSLKENIEPITNAIAKIRMINGVTYNKIGETHRTAGVIAQDVELAQPELVTQQGKYKSVAYGNMAGLFVEGIKEHDDEIVNLKREIQELKQIISELSGGTL